jgi:hypothetical protein
MGARPPARSSRGLAGGRETHDQSCSGAGCGPPDRETNGSINILAYKVTLEPQGGDFRWIAWLQTTKGPATVEEAETALTEQETGGAAGAFCFSGTTGIGGSHHPRQDEKPDRAHSDVSPAQKALAEGSLRPATS